MGQDSANLSAPTAPEAWIHSPRIRRMSRRQMECVLARNHVGRIAFATDRRIELKPVHYVYRDGLLFGRTSLGSTARAWFVRPDVVFEVDEVDGLFDWRSIIVRGNVTVLSARGIGTERMAYWSAVDAIRTLVQSALTERDPTPYRSVVFRIDPRELTGLEAGNR